MWRPEDEIRGGCKLGTDQSGATKVEIMFKMGKVSKQHSEPKFKLLTWSRLRPYALSEQCYCAQQRMGLAG